MQAIILENAGEATNLKVVDVAAPTKFKKTDVLVRQTYVGVNFFDVCFRRGQYGLEKMPAILGMEACGVVEAVGSGVVGIKPGQRVAYGTGPIGAYVEKRVIDAHHVVKVPDFISDAQAAASVLKAMMAHALLFRVVLAQRTNRILVHSAAGGVGQFLCQWAKYLGIEVIGAVGGTEKTHIARQNGCAHVVDYSAGDFVEQVSKATDRKGVGIVYDGVGKDTISKSLKCLWPMGLCVSYGDASGDVGNIGINELVENSLYLTRPTLALYKANRTELALAAYDIFDFIKKGVLKPKITEYAFGDVVRAHQDLESRKTAGSIVLKL